MSGKVDPYRGANATDVGPLGVGWLREPGPSKRRRALHPLSLAHLPFALSSPLLFFVAFLLFHCDLVFALGEPSTVCVVRERCVACGPPNKGERKGSVKTNLRSSSCITQLASASISSSSLNTSLETYEFRSLPNSFQISELNSASGARRFGGGGESEREGDRGRLLGGIPPDRGGAPLDADPDLAVWDLGTGLLHCEGLTEEDESLGIVDEDVLVPSEGLDALVPDRLDVALPFTAGDCDLAGGGSCIAGSA